MYDVRTLLTDEDYTKIAEILSLRGLDISTPKEAKAVIQETQSGEVLKVTRYYIAIKKLTHEALKMMTVPGSSIGSSAFKHALDQASRVIGNEYIAMIDSDSWDITVRRQK